MSWFYNRNKDDSGTVSSALTKEAFQSPASPPEDFDVGNTTFLVGIVITVEEVLAIIEKLQRSQMIPSTTYRNLTSIGEVTVGGRRYLSLSNDMKGWPVSSNAFGVQAGGLYKCALMVLRK